jgi:hypothetical protein
MLRCRFRFAGRGAVSAKLLCLPEMNLDLSRTRRRTLGSWLAAYACTRGSGLDSLLGSTNSIVCRMYFHLLLVLIAWAVCRWLVGCCLHADTCHDETASLRWSPRGAEWDVGSRMRDLKTPFQFWQLHVRPIFDGGRRIEVDCDSWSQRLVFTVDCWAQMNSSARILQTVLGRVS